MTGCSYGMEIGLSRPLVLWELIAELGQRRPPGVLPAGPLLGQRAVQGLESRRFARTGPSQVRLHESRDLRQGLAQAPDPQAVLRSARGGNLGRYAPEISCAVPAEEISGA